MASKSANVTARIEPEIKEKAEQILEKLGIPVSVLIDTLYRQIIYTRSIPYSLALPKDTVDDTITPEEIQRIMNASYRMTVEDGLIDDDE